MGRARRRHPTVAAHQAGQECTGLRQLRCTAAVALQAVAQAALRRHQLRHLVKQRGGEAGHGGCSGCRALADHARSSGWEHSTMLPLWRSRWAAAQQPRQQGLGAAARPGLAEQLGQQGGHLLPQLRLLLTLEQLLQAGGCRSCRLLGLLRMLLRRAQSPQQQLNEGCLWLCRLLRLLLCLLD